MTSMHRKGILITVLGILILAFTSQGNAQIPSSCLDNAPIPVYIDSFGTGWTDQFSGSWNVTINNSVSGVEQWGSKAIRVDHLTNWSGAEFKSNVPIGTTYRGFLSFRIRKEDSNGSLNVTAELVAGGTGLWVNLANYLVPGSQNVATTPGKWYSVRVPLSAMGITGGTPINGVLFMSELPSTVYLDEIVLIDGLVLAFPVPTPTPGTSWTANTAKISSVFDHNMTFPQGRETDDLVTAWSGEVGDGTPHSVDETCRPKSGGGAFTLKTPNTNGAFTGTYTGAFSCGGTTYLSYSGHHGIDFPVDTGTEVRAAATGVILAEEDGTLDCPPSGAPCTHLGRIRLKHPNGYTTIYMHLQSQPVPGKNIGATVQKGELIGYSGSTGTGSPHLHFGVTIGPGLFDTPIDPYGWEGSYEDPYKKHHPVFNSRQWE